MGEHKVKNLERPVHVFTVAAPGATADPTQALRQTHRGPDNHPTPRGGKGGRALSTDGAIALGGQGGNAGVGIGGDGGTAEAHGPGSVSVGGEGGSGPTADGKGGKGGGSSAQRYYDFIGKPMPRELRGWGVGGDGGDVGKPGQKGGAGLVKFTYKIKPVDYAPRSMFDLYQRESYADGNVSIEQFDAVAYDTQPVKVEVSLGWGMNCEKKQLWLHIGLSANTASIVHGLAPLLPKAVEKLDIQARAGITDPCIPSKIRDGYVPFSRDVTIYYEGELSEHDASRLLNAYADHRLHLVLRGPEYFDRKQKSWTSFDRQNSDRYKTRNVYHPGDL